MAVNVLKFLKIAKNCLIKGVKIISLVIKNEVILGWIKKYCSNKMKI